jgi:hypothetical protein
VTAWEFGRATPRGGFACSYTDRVTVASADAIWHHLVHTSH